MAAGSAPRLRRPDGRAGAGRRHRRRAAAARAHRRSGRSRCFVAGTGLVEPGTGHRIGQDVRTSAPPRLRPRRSRQSAGGLLSHGGRPLCFTDAVSGPALLAGPVRASRPARTDWRSPLRHQRGALREPPRMHCTAARHLPRGDARRMARAAEDPRRGLVAGADPARGPRRSASDRQRLHSNRPPKTAPSCRDNQPRPVRPDRPRGAQRAGAWRTHRRGAGRTWPELRRNPRVQGRGRGAVERQPIAAMAFAITARACWGYRP